MEASYVLFFVWLLSPSRTIVRLVRALRALGLHSFWLPWYMDTPQLVYPFTVDGHLGCFQFLTIKNKAVFTFM